MSLLSPFGFGQKHSYFHVHITIHELTNVPLVTGLFACKWKIKGSHSLASLQHAAAAAVHQTTSRAVSGAVRKGQHPLSAKDATKNIQATDHDSGASNSLSLGPPHEHGHRQASASTSADAASILSQSSRDRSHHGIHKPAFLSNLLHPNRDSDKADDDSQSQSSTPAQQANDDQDAPPLAPEEIEAGSSSPTSRRDSTTSRKTSTSRTKSIKVVVRHKTADTHDHNVDPLLFFTQEPKGETDFVKVDEHKVEWERDVQVGMRIGIGKPKTSGRHDNSPNHSHHDSPALSAKSSAKDLRSRAHLDDVSTAWGRLVNSEVKLTIKQEMPANAKSTTHPSVLGHVVLDLSEFAPDPPITSSSGRHHHHHHHHHHHQHHHHHHSHHHHHHQHGPGGEHSYRDRTCRSETRKFLLNDSKTNATVKITITMTFLGGAKEYYVPPISNGLMVNGLGSIVAPSLLDTGRDSTSALAGSEPASSHSGSSESSSLRNEPIRASASIRNQQLIGSGLPSASSLSLGRMGSSMHSQHNLYGPPLKSIYAKKTWTSRIPAENLVAAAAGSEAAKKKPHRTSEASFFSGRTQADRAPDDVVNAIFKGIPVGGSHNGQVQDEAAAAKAAAARAHRAERAAAAVDSQERQLRHKASKSPERSRQRVRTVSTTSNVSKKSERSFSFGLYRSKDKDKEKEKEKEKEKKEKLKAAKKGYKERSKSGSSVELESLSSDKNHGLHLSVPGSGGKLTPGLLVESPSASTDALPRTNSDVAGAAPPPSATRTSTKRLSSVRWNLDGDNVAVEPAPSEDTTPVAETLDKEERDRAAMPPPPSVVVDHAYIPIRAGGITAASSSALNLTQPRSDATAAQSAAAAEPEKKVDGSNTFLSPLPHSTASHPTTPRPVSTKDADAASIRSTASSAGGDPKKIISSNDLKGLYQASLSIPQSLSTSTAVGLDRLKRTSRAIGQFAKDATKSSSNRPFSRPNSSAGSGTLPLHDSQGVSGRERRSKGNRGIEPSEAASKGWQGAGWFRPISTAPVPLPLSPDLSSPETEEFEDADAVDRFGSLASYNSDGRRSSATDQTVVSADENFRPEHKRESSFASVYHDAEEDDDAAWQDEQVKLGHPAEIATAELPVHGQLLA
ncbi:uncharacterized protein UTRI_04031_B [Ustilago trichophora]|uniref:C2 NT-type domain-containing protein n=1 Tax=Ustilago trichophora TaxID=86804 RepID=A0A5C3E7L0_9BASI|nr:uncharacterized protein UTRI_04031_B [Ustilago trichophora]